jgi:choline dehydrogenase-like flavoprotein
VPAQDLIAHGASYDADYQGRNGPVKVGWPTAMTNSIVFPVLKETFEHLGVHYNRDSGGGRMVGFTVHPDTVDREANVRMDATRAYFWPYKSRPSLKIISNTQANRIIKANTTHGEISAIGVEVTGPQGVGMIYASKEVILSAGALRSPALLELSGVGNPDILRKYSIPVKVNLPTVGENLQDQMNNVLTWESKNYLTGLATFSALLSVNQLYGTKFLKWQHLSKPT